MQISNGAGRTSFSEVGVDANGNAIAAWLQRDNSGSDSDLYVSRYTPANGWSTPQLISENAEIPHVAFSSNGDAMVVWSERSGIYSRRYTPSGGWEAQQLVGGGRIPKVVMDNNGNAIAVWAQGSFTAADIYANRYTPGSGWGTPQAIESESGHANYPEIAVDGSGNVIAVWSQHDGTASSIYANRYTPGSGWGIARLIETENGDAIYPKIAIDANSNAIAVWQQGSGSASIYANRYTAGSGWGTAQLIESENGDASHPQLGIDRNGNAMAVWLQHDGTTESVYANRYTAGSGWGTAQLIESGSTYADPAYVAVDPSGNAIAVWAQHPGSGYKRLHANHYTPGGGWGTPAPIDLGLGLSGGPRIAISPSGNAIVIWNEGGTSGTNLYANRFE